MPRESRIQQEIKQTKPFPSKSEEAAVALMRTADLVRRYLSGVIEQAGITVQQYNVLRILRGAGEAGLPTLEIAERMIEQTPGITRLLDRLEARKLVSRVRCLTDRRQVFCHVTPAGLALLATLDQPVAEADATALSMFGRKELKQLIDLLDRARGSLTETLIAERRTTKDEPRRSSVVAHRSAMRIRRK